MGVKPSFAKALQACAPIKPAPPVTRTMLSFILVPYDMQRLISVIRKRRMETAQGSWLLAPLVRRGAR